MNSSELRAMIVKHSLNAEVVAWDEISGDGHCIVNSEPSTLPGRHWMCVFNSNPMEFFDPLGHDARHYNLDTNLKNNYVYNNTKVQGPFSVKCGQFCLFYLYHRCNGYTMLDIVNILDNSFIVNDKIVSSFVNKL